ncbi:MAG: hypothetical protein LBT56_00460 [Prevotellaceae bacterium]|jgi:hypothetical protein|nr:hypothetical protein [Prevotellaceae bacterium]
MGLLYGCVVELNKIRRHLINLRKITRKYTSIKIALEGYYNVTDELERNPQKAQEAFNQIIQQSINEEKDFEQEDDKTVKLDEKDKFVQQKTIEQILSVIKSLKS